MRFGQKSQIQKSLVGVKNSKLSQVLGAKQSHNPRLDVDTIIKHNNNPDGYIYNESNSNQNNNQPIKGVSLPNYKSNSNINSLENHIKLNDPPIKAILHKKLNINIVIYIYNATKTIKI